MNEDYYKILHVYELERELKKAQAEEDIEKINLIKKYIESGGYQYVDDSAESIFAPEDSTEKTISDSEIAKVSKKQAQKILWAGIKVFFKFPILIIPLALCCAMYATVLVYYRYQVPWQDYSFLQGAMVVFFVIVVLSFAISWSVLVLLELIRQIESDLQLCLKKALSKSFVSTRTATPIIFSWAGIWFVLAALEVFASLGKNKTRDKRAIQNVFKTIAGDGKFSLSAYFIKLLRKGVRMIVFLILPAIAWEKKDKVSSFRKGLSVAHLHKSEFLVGLVLTEIGALLIFAPPIVMFLISAETNFNFSDSSWRGILIYSGFAWVLMMFLEQIYAAELYLWHLSWEKENENNRNNGLPKVPLEEVRKPTLLDNIAELASINGDPPSSQ